MMIDSAKAHAKVHRVFAMVVTSSYGKVKHRSFSQVSLTSETVEAKRSTKMKFQEAFREESKEIS